MATNTCSSVITYQSVTDLGSDPFNSERQNFAEKMYNDGKCESWPNVANPGETPSYRNWIDHAAAQEFIDWVVITAPTYNIPILSTSIEDY